MARVIGLAGGLAAWLIAASVASAACERWGAPERAGSLDLSLIREASGLDASSRYPGRLYHNNDSGDGPNFYVTDASGGGVRKVALDLPKPSDVEELSLGPCPEGSCLYLGDIGDNPRWRRDVSFVVVAEKQAFADLEKPLRTVTARYPDGAHDAEAFALHPNGDLYLLTKSVDWRQRKSGVARLFRLRAAQLADASGAVQTFEAAADFDLPYVLSEQGFGGQVPTGMDIAADGKSVVFITYQVAVELKHDLSGPLPPSHAWVPGRDYQVIQTARLPQAEAIAYAPDGHAILYDTESEQGGEAPIYRQACEPTG